MNLHAVATAHPSQHSAPALPRTTLALTPSLRLKAARGHLARLPVDAGREARLEAVAAVWAALAAMYPVLVGVRPLAIGILEEVRSVVPEISRTALRQRLAHHVSQPAYLKACAGAGATRWHLDGWSAGLVSEGHRAHALKRLELER